MRAQTKERGFTILELIIAFTILGLIMLIIGGSLNMGVKAWEKGEQIADDSQRIRILYERLSSEIRSIYPYQIMKEGEKKIAFEGKPDSLGFVTSQVDINWIGGFKWVSYSVNDGNLIVTEKIVPDKKLDESKGIETILEAGVSYLKFDYFEKNKDNWETSWDAKEKGILPDVVRVSITLKPDSSHGNEKIERLIPPLFISLPVAYNPSGQ